MSQPNHRPRVLPDSVRMETTVPCAEGAALDSLAQATGEAKASHLRRAVSHYLATFELASHTATSIVNNPIKKEKAR